ncbi:MAG: MSCRAMM family protein, partial [Catonella sp.]|uniref:MSCRAMM family protein n=1 Tax=Catonella sp. TaxID=2382125 RepID=UPI003FA08B5B
MWKKHKYALLSLILMVGIFLTGVRLPQFAEAAGPGTVDKTGNTNVVKEHKITYVQKGAELDLNATPAPKIDLTDELTVTIKDKFNFDKNTADHIDDISYVEYELGQYFDFDNMAIEQNTIPDPDKTDSSLHNKTICKTTFTKDSEGKIKVRFDFGFADPIMFDQAEIEVKAIVKLKINQAEINDKNNGKIIISGQHYDVESSEEEFTVKKKGELNLNNGTVDWTVDVLRKKKGVNEQLSLVGYVFNDDLTAVGNCKLGTFTVNGVTKALESGGNQTKLSYTMKNEDFTDPNIGKAQIKFSTEISSGELYSGKIYRNKATVSKDNFIKESNEAVVKLTKFGTKKYEVVKISEDKHKIIWHVEINESNEQLDNVIIEDPLLKSEVGGLIQERESSYYQVWDDAINDWSTTTTTIAPDSANKYRLGTVNKKTRLTIETKDLDTNGGYYQFRNYAKIYWGSSTGIKVTFDNEAPIGKGKLSKSTVTFGMNPGETEEITDKSKGKIGDRRDSDKTNAIKRAAFETEWIAEVNIPDTDNKTYYLYDAFVFGKDIIANNGELKDTSKYKVTNFDGSMNNIRPGVNLEHVVSHVPHRQRLVNPEAPFTENDNGLSHKTYLIKKVNGEIIGHLLEISGFKKGKNVVKFKSKHAEPWALFGTDKVDSSVQVKNYMFLENESGQVIEIKGVNTAYNPKMLKKQALSKEAAAEFVNNLEVSYANNIINDDVFDSSSKTAKPAEEIKNTAFNIKDRSIIYRLSVNAAQINDTDGDLGVVTVTDTLPDDWELTKITGDKEYLIYKGTPATSVAKIDATVLAEGSPVELTPEKLEFVKTDNKLEFKFKKLDSPYVILFKAQLKEEKFKEYLNKKDRVVKNEAEISSESQSFNGKLGRWLTHTITSSQEVLINEEFLTKTPDTKAKEQEEKGYLKWNIVYTPYKDYTDNTKVTLEDVLGDKLSLRKEKDSKNLVFQGDNYRIFTGRLKTDGTFEEQHEITTGLSDIFKYDKDSKKFIITLPNSNETYKISYITDIVGDINAGISLANDVYLREGNAVANTVEVKKSYNATVASSGKVKGFEKLTIIKKNANGDKLLSGAKFKLTKNNVEVDGSPKITGADGAIEFERLSAGEYVLKEILAPVGYELNETEYKIKITDLENGKKVELLDNTGKVVSDLENITHIGNELIVKNEISDSANLGKLKISKKDSINSNPLYGAVFELKKGDILITGKTGITDKNGLLEYSKLTEGNYELTETKAPIGYKDNKPVYRFNVDNGGNINFTYPATVEWAEGILTVKNEAENVANVTSLKIIKKSSSNNSPLSGAEFELKKDNVAVTPEPKTTGANGEVTFEGLTEGTYVLKEVKAPNGYKKNDAEYVIKITKTGNKFNKSLDKIYTNATLAVDTGDLTITNDPLPSAPSGGGGTPPTPPTPPTTPPTTPTTPTTPVTPSEPSKPTEP